MSRGGTRVAAVRAAFPRALLLAAVLAWGGTISLEGGVPPAEAALGHRRPGSLPNPRLPPGTDTIPQIEHVIILMMENHSFDNYFGVLGRGAGFHLKNGAPTAANRDGTGSVVHAFEMPSACQLNGSPSQSWNASHISFHHGRNDGFLIASGPVAMGYFTANDIPFYYGLARTFPLADRWFSSTLCRTYPNRRFLMAGTPPAS